VDIGVAGGTNEQGGRRRRRLKYAVEYSALRGLVGLLHILPLDFASWLMGTIWRLVAPHLKRHDRALRHLAAAYPEKSDEQIQATASAMWMQLGRTFAESLMIERILRAGRINDRSGPDLEAVKAAGRGVVFVSMHSGNWELVITPAEGHGIKAGGVYQRMKNPRVDDYVLLARRDRYPRGLYPKGADIARKLLRIVREGGAIALLADLRDRRGIMVQFFGRPAPSTAFPALLARSSGAMLIAGRTIRTKGVHFIVETKVIAVPQTADRDADVEVATVGIHTQFEAWIREYPEQWMWAHRRWG
jgi:KDO2-lipid IV(A) lauroyltransferase